MAAFALAKATPEEKAIRTQAIQLATKYAIEIPFRVMEVAAGSMNMIKAMVQTGNPNSVTDAGVGALCVRSAVMGAFMNVRINAAGYNDKTFTADIIARGAAIQNKTLAMEAEILGMVNEKIGI